jgi:hypothetical protein
VIDKKKEAVGIPKNQLQLCNEFFEVPAAFLR